MSLPFRGKQYNFDDGPKPDMALGSLYIRRVFAPMRRIKFMVGLNAPKVVGAWVATSSESFQVI